MELHGVGVGRGIAVGPILRMPDPLPVPTPGLHAGDANAEVAVVGAALAVVAAELTARGALAGGVAGSVLGAAAMMAADPVVAEDIRARILAGSSAEWAVFEAFGEFEQRLTALGGDFAERAADVRDVARRVIARLRGVPAPGVPHSDTPFVLVAHDLAPADTVLLELDRVLGFVTRDGGPTSHTAILARAKGIPAIVGVAGALDLADGTVVIVDAASGRVSVDPGPAAIAVVRASRPGPGPGPGSEASAPLAPGVLADGTRMPLLANLGSLDDASAAVDLGAEGVGLLRTEFLFLGAQTPPSVEEQAARYTEVLRHFPGKPVTVRVLDAGADKPLAYLAIGAEQNPALGMRGLRALRAHESVLRDQLTALALAQAATDAQLQVMAPMVADADEAGWFVAYGRALGLHTLGVMAEVPSLAILAEQVVAVSDFISIGTNDLTQYVLASDRSLAALAGRQDPWHPAVLRLVKLIADAGAAAGKPVGVCGEAAADPQLAVVLVGVGVTSLSMAPSALADVRAALAAVTLVQARERAAAALGARTAEQARALGS